MSVHDEFTHKIYIILPVDRKTYLKMMRQSQLMIHLLVLYKQLFVILHLMYKVNKSQHG